MNMPTLGGGTEAAIQRDHFWLRHKPFEAQDKAHTRLTLDSVIRHTAILLTIFVAAYAWVWHSYHSAGERVQLLPAYLFGGLLGAIVAMCMHAFNPQGGRISGPLLALCMGFSVGGLTGFARREGKEGLVFLGANLTFVMIFLTLAAFKYGLLKSESRFMRVVLSVLAGIVITYVLAALARLSAIHVGLPHELGFLPMLGVFLMMGPVVWELNMNFEFVQHKLEEGASANLSWYCATALLMSILSAYMSIMSFLSRLTKR